jgi:hypothetical protein
MFSSRLLKGEACALQVKRSGSGKLHCAMADLVKLSSDGTDNSCKLVAQGHQSLPVIAKL